MEHWNIGTISFNVFQGTTLFKKVAKLQSCNVAEPFFDVGAAESELFVFDMNYYDEIFNFAINIKCVLLISIVYIIYNLIVLVT